MPLVVFVVPRFHCRCPGVLERFVPDFSWRLQSDPTSCFGVSVGVGSTDLWTSVNFRPHSWRPTPRSESLLSSTHPPSSPLSSFCPPSSLPLLAPLPCYFGPLRFPEVVCSPGDDGTGEISTGKDRLRTPGSPYPVTIRTRGFPSPVSASSVRVPVSVPPTCGPGPRLLDPCPPLPAVPWREVPVRLLGRS